VTESKREKFHLTFMGMLSVGFIGYFALQEHWAAYLFAHLTALGILAFYGSLAGWVAERKGYCHKTAFNIGFFLPLCLGVLSAFLLAHEKEYLTCGGWTVLVTGIIVVMSYGLLRSTKTDSTS